MSLNKKVSNSQRFIFSKVTKIIKIQVTKATPSITRLVASLDIHYNNSLNTGVQKKQWDLNKENSNKSCWQNDFQDSLQYIFPIDIKFSYTFIKSMLRENFMVETSTTLTGFILFYQGLPNKNLIYPVVQARWILIK